MSSAINSSGYSFANGGRIISAFSNYILGEDVDRLNRYKKNWRWYKGEHWDDRADRAARESNEDPLVTLNYARRSANIQAMFLTKRGFDITLPDEPGTAKDESVERMFVKNLLDKTWRYNKKDLLCVTMGIMGSITGDVFIRVSWREKSILAPAHARLELLPSQWVFPEFTGETLDQSMSRCTVMWPTMELREIKTLSAFRSAPRKKEALVIHREVWTDDTVTRYEDGVHKGTSVNPFGIIPIVHIPNFPVPGEFFGASDLDDVIRINREMNEKSTDMSDVINYHGSPTTVITGARANQLVRGANRIWSLPTGDAKNLEMKGDLAASHRYYESLKTALYDVSGIPASAFGGTPPKPGTSGAALALEFMPLLDSREVKSRVYGIGLQTINALILKVSELKDPAFAKDFLALPEEDRYITNIAWPPALPRDEAITLGNIEKRMNMGLLDRTRALKEQGHGEADAARIIADVDDERLREAIALLEASPNSTASTPPLPRSGNPDPQRPNPDAQGQSLSITKQLEEDS